MYACIILNSGYTPYAAAPKTGQFSADYVKYEWKANRSLGCNYSCFRKFSETGKNVVMYKIIKHLTMPIRTLEIYETILIMLIILLKLNTMVIITILIKKTPEISSPRLFITDGKIYFIFPDITLSWFSKIIISVKVGKCLSGSTNSQTPPQSERAWWSDTANGQVCLAKPKHNEEITDLRYIRQACRSHFISHSHKLGLYWPSIM